jgi:hypothetical protein
VDKGLKVKNPWVSMWTQPRATIRSIISTRPKYGFPVLSALYGFPTLLQFAQTLSLGASTSWVTILLVAVLLSTFVGMLGILISTVLLHWTGRWIGGKSTFQEMRAAVSWANVTNSVTSIVWIILILVFGRLVFMDTFSSMQFTGGEQLLIFGLFLIQTIVSIWSIVILVKAVAEVQGFSAWKGLLNLILPVIIVILVVWAIGLFVGCGMDMPTQVQDLQQG